jgi:hypothetical protein
VSGSSWGWGRLADWRQQPLAGILFKHSLKHSRHADPEEIMITRHLALLFALLLSLVAPSGKAQQRQKTFEQYLRDSAVPLATIDTYLKGPAWAQFDPELGYRLWNYVPSDGIDNSATISTIQENGARTAFLYAWKKCRINTYGNSFTQCHQVSDGETWQEYLAGHLGEPVRNFGMGGYGVYQAYRRMIREEKTTLAAPNLIFYIWGDDHIRSLLRCRHAIIYPQWDHQGGRMFHNNFWPNIEMNLDTGQFLEKENILNTRESLYQMTDPQWMVDHLKDDLGLQLFAYMLGYVSDLDTPQIDRLARVLHISINWGDESNLHQQVGALLEKYSLEGTKYILRKVKEFSQKNQKNLLVVLFDPYRAMQQLAKGAPRYDESMVEFLQQEKFNYFDMNPVHIQDFKKYNLSFQDYMKEYFIGHYNPRGNHFFAYSIRDKVVEMLDPKPLPYQKADPAAIDFKGYLVDYK